MIALIDADLVAFRSAASCEPTSFKPYREPLEMAIQRADELYTRILAEVDVTGYHGFLTGSNNYRKLVYPAYKEHRRDLPMPEWLNPVREWMVDQWKVVITPGYEADDAIGMMMSENTICCSIDKDLLQLPGWHYNFVKKELKEVSEYEGELNFWTQMLTGDRSDNVLGIHGIGPKKASNILAGSDNFRETVREVYEAHDMMSLFDINQILLRILRSETEYNAIMETIYERPIEESQGEKSPTESSKENPIEVPESK